MHVHAHARGRGRVHGHGCVSDHGRAHGTPQTGRGGGGVPEPGPQSH